MREDLWERSLSRANALTWHEVVSYKRTSITEKRGDGEDNDIEAEREERERNAVTRRISDTIKTDDEISEGREGCVARR